MFVESRCTNPDFNKNIFIDASTSATNRDKVNEVANRPLVIAFTITEYDARKQYFIKVETEGGVLIDKVKIAKPISENDNQQKVKYYETNGNALEGTVLTKIYNNLEGSLEITLYYNYTDSRGITTTATIGAPVNVNSKVSQNYPTYSVPTLNPVDSKTSSERLYNIRYNINSWIDFSKTEIKEKVASVFNDGGLASNILEAHVRPSFTPLKITDKDKLDWLIDSEGNILIEWQALEELNRNQAYGIDFIKLAMEDWALSLVANFADYDTDITVAKGTCNTGDSKECEIRNNILGLAKIRDKLKFENLAYLLTVNKIKVVNTNSEYNPQSGVYNKTMTQWQTIADAYVFLVAQAGAEDQVINGLLNTTRGYTFRNSTFNASGSLVFDVPPVCVVFRNAFASMNGYPNNAGWSNADINDIMLMTACHELGHGWSIDMNELRYSNTDARLSHNYYCNGENKEYCIFRYIDPSSLSNGSSVNLKPLIDYTNKQRENYSFCEGHKQILINRLCVQNPKNEGEQ